MATFLVFKSRIPFDTSFPVVFLNENTELSFFCIILRILICFSNVSVIVEKECVFFWGKIITIVWYF